DTASAVTVYRSFQDNGDDGARAHCSACCTHTRNQAAVASCSRCGNVNSARFGGNCECFAADSECFRVNSGCFAITSGCFAVNSDCFGGTSGCFAANFSPSGKEAIK